MYCSHVDFSVSAVAESGCDVSDLNNEIELKQLTTSTETATESGDDGGVKDDEERAPITKDSSRQIRRLILIATAVSLIAAVVSSSKNGLSLIGIIGRSAPPPRPTFVRFYSPGHCGTRFLTEIFMTNAVTNTHNQNQTSQQYATSCYWNEDNLFLGPYTRAANLSLAQYQQHIGIERFLPTVHSDSLDIDTSCFDRFTRNCHAKISPQRVFMDDLNRLQLKAWNREGNRTELERYLVKDRIPKLLKVMNFFGPKDGLSQLVKFGHTHIFYDLETYHRSLSKEFNVKWVRIRRRRINVARSFAQDRGGSRPDPCLSEKGVVVCPFDGMSILKPNQDEWDGWTVFMQHLWFVDEIEARWQVFLKGKKDSWKNSEIFTIKFQEDTDTISPSDIDELATYMNVTSPRGVMGHMPHLSHIAGPKMNETAMETEAMRYSQEAPWCSQNDMVSPVGFELDCSPDAY